MTDASAPLVSVVIPIFDGERFLEKAVQSCLAQTHANIEVILVDDGSSDGSRGLAERIAAAHPSVRCEHHAENQGVSAAWNTGFSSARGALLLRLAQDDCLEPDAVERLAAAARSHPVAEAVAVYADWWAVREDGVRERGVTPPPGELFRTSNRVGLCVAVTAQAWKLGVRYDPEFRAAEDLDFFTRLRESGVEFVKCEGEPAMNVLAHADTGTNRMRVRQELETAKVIARSTSMDAAVKRRLLARNYSNAAYLLRKQSRRAEALEACKEGLRHAPFSGRLWRQALRLLLP